MTIESIALRDLRLVPLHCHRNTIVPERVATLADRIRALVQLPPLRGWRSPDGTVVLADGFHRFLALRQLAVPHASVLVWQGTWLETLVQALLANAPRNEGIRKGHDAERALLLLANALGRPVRSDEAAALGLECNPHCQPPLEMLRMIRLPAELEMAAYQIAREAPAAADGNGPSGHSVRRQVRPKPVRRS